MRYDTFIRCIKKAHIPRNDRRNGNKRGTESLISEIESRTFKSLGESRALNSLSRGTINLISNNFYEQFFIYKIQNQ